MKLYYRILLYSPKIKKELVLFFLFALLSVLFNTAYLGMIQPMLEILFDQKEHISGAASSSPFGFIKVLFEENFRRLMEEHGRMTTLLFICVGIIILVFFSNTFR